MRKIREQKLEDSTVTIVLVGSCTHSRRYVDWEVKASLQQGQSLPNGLITINLPYMGTRGALSTRCQVQIDFYKHSKFFITNLLIPVYST